MAAGALNWAYPAAAGLYRGVASYVAEKATTLQQPRAVAAAPRASVSGTPEIYFAKAIDNSRLVKVADPARARELAQFVAAFTVLFLLMMVYAWQHFSAVEYGYKIESARAQRDALVEVNRELRLEEAALRDPERIDQLAHKLGLESPEVGQVAPLEQAPAELAAPVMAQATPLGTSDAVGAR